MENVGFTISTKAWLDAYDKVYQEAHKVFVESIKKEAKENPAHRYHITRGNLKACAYRVCVMARMLSGFLLS